MATADQRVATDVTLEALVDAVEALPNATQEAADNANAAAEEARAAFEPAQRAIQNTNEILQDETEFYSITAVPGWSAGNYFFREKSLQKNVVYYFSADFSPQVSGSAYIFLYNDATSTEILHRQVQDMTHLDFSYKAEDNYNNVSCYINGESISSKCSLKFYSSNMNEFDINSNILKGMAEEDGTVSILRYSAFIRGGNYYDNFYDYAYMVSTRDPIVAPKDLFIQIKSGYAASFTRIDDQGNVTQIGWKTVNFYINKGTKFVVRIRKNPLDETDVADIVECVNALQIMDDEFIGWKSIKLDADSLVVGKQVGLDGNLITAGNYWFLYTIKYPKFKYIRVHASSLTDTTYEIAFFRDTEASSQNIDTQNSVHLDSGWDVTLQTHYTCAIVPDDCKMICISSRNLLNDNTPFDPDLYCDDMDAMMTRNSIQRDFGLQLFNNNKYIYHAFVDQIGSGNFLIPPQSLTDITVAHRLGYKAIELNCHATATAGKYICMHGTSGKIGDELIARDQTDISNVAISSVTYETFRNDYIYNSTDENYQTHVTFLEDALYLCKKLGLTPVISLPEGDFTFLNIVRGIMGDKFVLLVYNSYYLNRLRFKGAYNCYIIDGNSTTASIDEMCRNVGAPFLVGISEAYVESASADTLKEYADIVHKHDCLIGSAGVYINAEGNLKLSEIGADFNSTGNEVEYFETGNIVNSYSNGTFEEFDTDGTVDSGALDLSDGEYISSTIRAQRFLSKAILSIRFSGTISVIMGDQIYNLSLTSDGSKAVELSTFFVNASPDFTVYADGAVTVYECNYRASEC